MNEQDQNQDQKLTLVEPSGKDRKKSGPEIIKAYLEFMLHDNNIDELNKEENQEKGRKILEKIGIIIPEGIPFFFNTQQGGPSVWIVKGNEAYRLSEEFNLLSLIGNPSTTTNAEEFQIGLVDTAGGLTVNLPVLQKLVAENRFDDISSLIMVEQVGSPYINSMESTKLPVINIFTASQQLIINKYAKKNNAGYQIVVSLPFLDVSKNKVFSFALDKGDEIILTSC